MDAEESEEVMGAPSKEELDRLIARAGRRLPITRPEAWRAITALAGEVERLRAENDDCRRVIEMKRADEPLWDKLGEIAGELVKVDGVLRSKKDIEIAKLRAERAEMLAMLESWDIGGRPVEGTHSMVAKLRGAP